MSSIHKTNNDKIKFRNNIEDLNIHKKIKNYENKCRLLGDRYTKNRSSN